MHCLLMRVITIFSEKGGIGKTTLSIMLVSFLAYEKKQKVFACDFDFPGYQMLNTRENDLRLISCGIRDLVNLKYSRTKDCTYLPFRSPGRA